MKSFFKTINRNDSHVLTTQIAERFAEEAGPYSNELKTLIRTGDLAALANLELDYSRFSCPSHVFSARSCLALYQKCDDFDLGVNKEAVAFEKFQECEATCKRVNQQLRQHQRSDPKYWDPKTQRMNDTLERAKSIIVSILGLSPPKIDDLPLAFGPGASSNVKKNTSARWKLSAIPACSANMASTVCDVLATMPHYCELHDENPEQIQISFEDDEVFNDEGLFWEPENDRVVNQRNAFWKIQVAIEPGKLMFVPKNAKTDRSIIVEPTLNSYLQKGYGSVIKQKLLRSGVNLYDQSINNARARKGSINGSLATIDLSSASDTISKELISLLLPLDWYIALYSARTTHVVYKSNLVPGGETEFHLEKFSSMGNGFTFELESLIFYALTVAVCRGESTRPDVTVFGDDIICPPSIYHALETVFTFCGFSINKSKSFVDGDFRESCGKDYFRGVNVRPYYNKTRWNSAALTAFHNCLVRSGWSLMYPDVLEQIIGAIKPLHRLYGPDGYGDGHLITDDLILTPKRRARGWSGFTFETFVSRPVEVRVPVRGDAIMPHYASYIRASKEGEFNPFTVRGHKGSKKISVYVLGR